MKETGMNLYVVRRIELDGKKEYLSAYIVSDGSRRDLEICWSDAQGEALRMRRDVAEMAASHQGMGSRVVRLVAKKPMPTEGDVDNRPRKFLVYVDRKIPGQDPEGTIVDVAPGEDADEACEKALNDLIANEVYTGWCEASAEDIKRYG